MTDDELRRAVEAVLVVAVEPVRPQLLAELVEQPAERVEAVCESLAASLADEGRGFVVAKVAGGYRLQTHPSQAPYVERFANRGVSARLSTAALESLAIVAYRQPVSRAQIASLRGVNVDGVVRLLEQRGYIEPVGRAPGPGQPVLYGTTELFLERLGLDRLDQLPPVEDLLPGPEVAGELERDLRASLGRRRGSSGGSDPTSDGSANGDGPADGGPAGEGLATDEGPAAESEPWAGGQAYP